MARISLAVTPIRIRYISSPQTLKLLQRPGVIRWRIGGEVGREFGRSVGIIYSCLLWQKNSCRNLPSLPGSRTPKRNINSILKRLEIHHIFNDGLFRRSREGGLTAPALASKVSQYLSLPSVSGPFSEAFPCPASPARWWSSVAAAGSWAGRPLPSWTATPPLVDWAV